MKNYRDSDYALNKHSGGIVYRFADGAAEITMEDYLAANPDKTREDFLALKKISDGIYFKQDRTENAHTNRNISLAELEETAVICEQSPEEAFVDAIDDREKAQKRRQRLILIEQAMEQLTKTQRRRYLLYVVNGLNESKIATLEYTSQQAVSKSLISAEKKIKKFLAQPEIRQKNGL